MLQDIKKLTTSTSIVVIKCKSCDQIVQKNSIHSCLKTGKKMKVKLGAHVSDYFYKDKGKSHD